MQQLTSTDYKKLFENLACGVYSSSKEGRSLYPNGWGRHRGNVSKKT
ncbi:MAG: hypothetical protein JRI92_12370 [Deltaproteobacteria bacterium]|nr:hypothetical protein [Deltaproteobacteria bacterium]